MAPTPPSRDYARLFTAMNEVLGALAEGGGEEKALRRSFGDAARGFGADKALLLLVEERDPLRLRHVLGEGLSPIQVQACERGESVPGVSASVIRAVVESRTTRVIPRPRLDSDPDGPSLTPALAGHDYSVLCAPVLDLVRGVVFAVMYFQSHALDPDPGYGEADAVWLEGYASALGRAFAFYFQEQKRERELADVMRGARRTGNAPDIVGDSAHTYALRRTLHETYIPAAGAPDPDPVLILGEKGTGKDLVARYLHAYSARGSRPFVALNCAEVTDELAAARFFGHKRGSFTGAITDEPGVFRAAEGGTLFLDEIAELTPRAQAVLLRVLENRTVVPVGETREIHADVQVVLATNRDLEAAVTDGVLKQDFVDRFQTQTLQLQPLRERPWDIPALVRHFIRHHERRTRKKTLGLTDDAVRAMISYPWPGNVRELARVSSLLVTRAGLGASLDRAALAHAYPPIVQSARNPKAASVIWGDAPMDEALRAFQRELILARLERHQGRLRAARESLGIPKTTFRRYLIELGIRSPGPANPEGPDEE
jgi:DNA-binding NtrC family response regulator